MASAQEIIAVLMGLPATPFAQLSAQGDVLRLSCDGRILAETAVCATAQAPLWSANHTVNQLAHQALFTSDLAVLPAGEAVNIAHQVIEWWDAAICAISALTRRSRAPDNAENRIDHSA